MFYRNGCEGFKDINMGKLREGSVITTKNFGDIVITKYLDKDNIHIRFINTGYNLITQSLNIRQGTIKDRLAPAVFGVGVLGEVLTTVDGVRLKEYELWKNMIKRCYSKNFHEKFPTYSSCSVSENFKYYPYFKEWCNKQAGYTSQDDKGNAFQLDKDILVKGNKVYSEELCVFVPKEINMLMVKCGRKRGEYNIGVYYNKTVKKFVAKLKVSSKYTYIGSFNTEIEAFQAYKEAKEANIKEVANKWKDQIDPRVYEALMNYVVEITD